jgi:rare lipoprotein A
MEKGSQCNKFTVLPFLRSHLRMPPCKSWYGPGFHGRTTANGERYNMHGLTAAHKSLPFGKEVKVTNGSNGKAVIVRINDRGPFVCSRIIDLSKKAAEAIDMIGRGTASVTVEVLT